MQSATGITSMAGLLGCSAMVCVGPPLLASPAVESNGLTPSQQLNTCLVRLGEGYDIALIANSQAPVDVVSQCVAAFEVDVRVEQRADLVVRHLAPGA